jgi:hypothetical protein
MIHKWATTTDLKHEAEQVQAEYQATNSRLLIHIIINDYACMDFFESKQ